MDTIRLAIDGVEVGERLRPLDHSRVEALKGSIKELGLRTPITVMSRADGADTRMILVAGLHRLTALRELGEESVDCLVVGDDEIGAQLWEIAENLHRSDLSKDQRDEHIRRYAELLQMRGEVSTQVASKPKNGRPAGIASQVAKETGVSADTVRRALNPARVQAEQNRSRIDADVKSRAAKEVADIIAEHVPGEWWDAVKANLYAAGAKNIANELTNVTGQSIMDRRHG